MSAVIGSDQARGIEATVDINEAAEQRVALHRCTVVFGKSYSSFGR
jgi:hypothetical protein